MVNRKSKNIIMSVVLILLIIGTIITVKFAIDSKGTSNDNQVTMNEHGRPDGETPPDMNNNGGIPPEKPDGDNGEIPPEKPDGNNDGMKEPPSMDNSNSSSNSDNNSSNSNSSNQNGMEPPSMDSNGGPGGGTPPDMNNKNNNGSGNTNSISTTYYVLFGVEGLLIGLITAYLILSAGNKKAFKQTFSSNDKKVLFLLSSILVATLVIGGDILATDKINNKSSNQQEMNKKENGDSNNVSSNATASEVVTENKTLSDKYSSSTSDESAILVKEGAEVTIDGAEVTKTGDTSNTENSEFYGINAGILVTEKSTATIKNANITTDAKGSNAVFSTGTDSKIYISDTKITTTGSSSARGLDATYGGYIEADNVEITTQGGSCATLATDRGEGTVIANNSKLETNGSGSPIIYSTGDISIKNTTGTANGSQMVVIEGKNSATVTSSTLDASGKGNRRDTDMTGIMIYQSMSGDASEGTGTFTAKDSTLKIQSDSDYYKKAPMFFITNTTAVINLENTKLLYGSNLLISSKGTSEWGNSNSNGGDVTLNATKQELVGNIEIDKISTLTMNLTNSTYKGTINGDNTAKSIVLKLDKDSKITLTGDSYITSLDNEDSLNSNIDFNGYKLYVNGKKII